VTVRITAAQARRLAIAAHGLDGRWGLPAGKAGVNEAVRRLGYVQIDTIAVVRRAHHHTLYARCPDYTPEMLHELQARDRRVFEYWSPSASYLPIEQYRYHLPRMRAVAAGGGKWWRENRADLLDHVLERIRAEGPLGSSDFAAPKDWKRSGWWNWKPAKQALEVLFDVGELMVTERRNFQRVYDLTERVLPAGVDTSVPDADETARFFARRQITGSGLAAAPQIGLRRTAGKRAETALAEFVESGEATPVEVAGTPAGPMVAWTPLLEHLGQCPHGGTGPLHILSPFDSFVARYGRGDLFGFDHKLEAYFPAHKRRYGYFCLPILWGDRFVGRLDPKADRKAATLIVKKLWLERGVASDEGLVPALADTLRRYAAFNECERVVIEESTPKKVLGPLRRGVDGGAP
jgi:uncharacterized protein YcaQ